MKKWDIFRILLGIAILLLLVYNVGVDAIVNSFSSMNIFLFVLVIVLFWVGLLAGALNLKILTDSLGKGIGFVEMLRYYLISWAFGMVIPGKLGEFTFVALARKKLSLGEGTAIAVLDKVITAITLAFIAIFGFFIFFTREQAIILTSVTLAAMAAACFFILSKKGRGLVRPLISLAKSIFRRGLGKDADFSGFSATTAYFIETNRTPLVLNLVITFLKWCLTAVVTYFAFLAFGQNLSLLMILVISSTTMLISLIPITMSGLGIKEGAAVYLYGLVGVPAAVTISVHVILLFLNYANAALVFFLVKK